MMRVKYVVKLSLLAVLMAIFFAGCGSGGTDDAGSGQTAGSTDKTAVILTVSGTQGEKEYSLEQLEELGMETCSYSGRNKENNNERQVREYTGVKIRTLLEDAGYGKPGETMKVICSDGYSREYELDSLYDLYFFNGEDAKKGDPVEPMLEVIQEGESMGNDKIYHADEGSPLRLVFGQTDYDSDYTMDFNMQGWASYVEKIEVSETNE